MEKAWHINVLELEAVKLAILFFFFFFYKIQKTKFDSSTDRQHDSSLLFIKRERNPKQTFDPNLERSLGLSHREKNTFDSRICTQSEQSNSRLVITKLPGQQ